MQTYELIVMDRTISVNGDDATLVRTSIGVDQIHVMFDNAEWLSFPVTVTVANGERMRSKPITLTRVSNSADWSAESTFVIPWEAVQSVGRLRVTFQGTDTSGNHIITAYGAPLLVEEAGDVTMGDIPEDAPTISQYEDAYNRVVQALAQMEAALGDLGSFVRCTDVATVVNLGIVRPDGETLTIGPDGTLSLSEESVLSPATTSELGGVIPDGETITVDEDGTIHSSPTYSLPVATDATLGGFKVGSGLWMGGSGTLNVDFFTEEQIVELTPMDGVVEFGDDTEY